MPKRTAFESEVLTRLEYIAGKQKDHDDKLDSLDLKFDVHKEKCDSRFKCVESDVNQAKGIAAGFAILGSAIGAVVGWFFK